MVKNYSTDQTGPTILQKDLWSLYVAPTLSGVETEKKFKHSCAV